MSTDADGKIVVDNKEFISPQGSADLAFDEASEKKLIRKIDWRLLPILGALYSIALIDRTNVSDQALGSKYRVEMSTDGC